MNVETPPTTIAEYSVTAAALAHLSERYRNVTYDVHTKEGMEAAKKARAELRRYRIDLEAKRQEIKAPALERARQIDSEAARITSTLTSLEDPIARQIKAEEERIAAEKAARAEAERQRVESLQKRLMNLRILPATATGLAAEEVAGILACAKDMQIGEDFAEFRAEALEAHASAVNQLTTMLDAQRRLEAEQARAAAERAELEKMRAEQRAREEAEAAARRREEEQRRAELEEKARAAERELAEARAKIEAEQREARERIAAEERAAHEKRAAEEANLRAEREKVEAELRAIAEQQRAEREAQEAKERAIKEQAEAARREEQRQANEAIEADEMLKTFRKRFGHRPEFAGIVVSIDSYFQTPRQKKAA